MALSPQEELQRLAAENLQLHETVTKQTTELEHKNRELEIELALETVRARTMAMQRSEELSETAQILFQQLKELGETPIQITIGIFNEEESVIDFNVTDWGGAGIQIGQKFKASIDEPTLMNKIYRAWKANQKSIVVDLTGQELLNWVAYRNAMSGTTDHQFKLHDRRTVHVGLFSKGLLSFSTHEPRPAESVNVLERFASVFDQTYTRFLDLKQAEAQAKESQIQLALERVRARTMAMQRSDELKNAAALLFQQIKALGVPAYSCGYNIWEKGENEFTSWMSTQDGSIINGVPNIPLTEDANFIRYVKSKQNGEEFFVLELRGERMQEHYEYLKTIPAFKAFFEYAISVGFDLPQTQIHHLANFSNGNLLFITLEPCPEFHEVFKRFAAVFEQTYTRFLDLQKAEAQTREAQIEAALEKVRSRSLAVHQSEEFKEVINIVFEKLEDLGLKVDTASINIFIEGSKDTDVYACGHNENGLDIRKARLRYFDHPIANDLYNVHKNGMDFFVGSYGKEEKNSYYTYQFEHGDLKALPAEIKERILQTEEYSLSMVPAKHSVIILNNIDGKRLSEIEIDIVKRFARVFDQAYTRFLDLQKAEAQTREAQVETALEKVRSRSLAMHKSDEIQDVLHAVFERMKELNLDFFSATIIIFQEGTRDMEWWLANKMNQQYRRMTVNYADVPLFKKLFAAKESGVELFADSYSFEEKNKLFTYFFEHTDFRHTPDEQKKFILSSESLSLSIGLTRNIAIQISNYSLKQFSEKEIEILLRFTKVFDQAYTRFRDLQRAEHLAEQAQEDLIKLQIEKKRAEEALTELRATQAQLIQSEKMASLGELTAGIAHEIQNPLNFVNNFSEVNTELIDELKDELATGNLQQAKEIAGNIKDNEEKIVFHGKRADAIVKGMLQHSRSSNSVKEPTDINALADEYLRLAYHGLRAKDKTFNATIKTDFDPNIGLINVVPQDIGRVILNLITNAFYAVSTSPAPKSPEGDFRTPHGVRDPTVIVSTKRFKSPSGDLGAEIRVSDNGPGIPQNILDKIFQPFFTTKPTGQGTGLGLSLSYDIIKAHGGELKVETKEGEGTEFIILLPIT